MRKRRGAKAARPMRAGSIAGRMGQERRARGEKAILKVGDQNQKPDKEEDALKEKIHLLLFYKKANRITYSEHEHAIVRLHAFLIQKSRKRKKWLKDEMRRGRERRFFDPRNKSLAPRRAHGLSSYKQFFQRIAELEVKHGTKK